MALHDDRRPVGRPGAPRPRSRIGVVAAVAVGIAALAGLLGFGLTREPGVLRSALVGRPAPDFELRTLDGGRTIGLDGLRGQVVVVNFWASWCTECRIEHPALAEVWRRYRDRGVVVLGIPFHDTEEDSRRYLRELGGDWPILADPGARTALSFGVYGIPETYVIGPDGRISSRHVGPVTYPILSEEITRVQGAAP
ncbi:MAG: TlpA family protein disulfide reductase [Actinomycetota bacterium]